MQNELGNCDCIKLIQTLQYSNSTGQTFIWNPLGKGNGDRPKTLEEKQKHRWHKLVVKGEHSDKSMSKRVYARKASFMAYAPQWGEKALIQVTVLLAHTNGLPKT